MKKSVFAVSSVIAASMLTSALAEPVIGSNVKAFIGIPSNSELEYDSSLAFELDADVFLTDAIYFTAAWGAIAYGAEENGNNAQIGQGHFLVGLGYEHDIKPGVAIFGEAAIGALAGTAEVNGTEVYSAEGTVTRFGIGVRSNTPNYYSDVMLTRNTGTWDGGEPDTNISAEADVGLNVSEKFTIGLRSIVDIDFENTLIGATAGFKF